MENRLEYHESCNKEGRKSHLADAVSKGWGKGVRKGRRGKGCEEMKEMGKGCEERK